MSKKTDIEEYKNGSGIRTVFWCLDYTIIPSRVHDLVDATMPKNKLCSACTVQIFKLWNIVQQC